MHGALYPLASLGLLNSDESRYDEKFILPLLENAQLKDSTVQATNRGWLITSFLPSIIPLIKFTLSLAFLLSGGSQPEH